MSSSRRRPINKGSLVDVAPESRPGKRYSEGGRGVVEKKKKKRKVTAVEAGQDDEFIFLTQETAATEISGETVFQVKYTLDN